MSDNYPDIPSDQINSNSLDLLNSRFFAEGTNNEAI